MCYKLVILHPGGDWPDEVEAAVRTALRQTVLSDGLLEVLQRVPRGIPAGSQIVVAFLADLSSANDDEIRKDLVEARASSYPVVPIVRAGAKHEDVLPNEIRFLNSVSWDEAREDCLLAFLEHLGLVEEERKLFLSYRRSETEHLAIQLRESLCQRRFDVFLDRFSVPPGEDFSVRIDQELADKAFVLLLESRSAIGSEWVQHEVSYALSHHISLLALSTPDADPLGIVGSVDEAFRCRLTSGELVTPGILATASLDRVLAEVEMKHARQMRRRRIQLLGSLQDWLQRAGFSVDSIADWALLATRTKDVPKVYYVTPRPPKPEDLRIVDELRSGVSSAGVDPLGFVVHEAEEQSPRRNALNQWIIAGRPLDMICLRAVPGALGL